tara:strand:- start:18 stop:722 length:705 start_codon:yes stop_codon:yes gene_type:complete
MIPPGSVVDSFLLFSGELELALARSNRFVVAHTNKFIIYEFWKCALSDPDKIITIALDLVPHLTNENMFNILQEEWPRYRDSFVRSAFFFLLNRFSDKGLLSSGKLTPTKLNPLTIASLKNFKVENFEVMLDPSLNFIECIEKTQRKEYLLFPIGKFNYNLFDYGKNKGHEITLIHHQRFYDAVRNLKENWIVLYKQHPQVHILYKDYPIIMLDKYGRKTTQKNKCEDLVIANF